jgi:hypothetical protein
MKRSPVIDSSFSHKLDEFRPDRVPADNGTAAASMDLKEAARDP